MPTTVYHIHNQLTGKTEALTDWAAAQVRQAEIRAAYHASIEHAFQIISYTDIGDGRHFLSPVDAQGNPTLNYQDYLDLDLDPGPVESTVEIITGESNTATITESLPSEPVNPP